jgi:hypothetical protein
MQESLIVLRDGCFGANLDSDELRRALFDLLTPEKRNSLPGCDRVFGVAVHEPLVIAEITRVSASALAIPIYQWLATSELIKYCAKKQWHHPVICPKKYPRGLNKPAIALGELWKAVWELLHYWSTPGQTLIVFEELTREIGGLLIPYAWKADDAGGAPQVCDSWHVARHDRRYQERHDRYIRRAAALIRERQNPYAEDSKSYWFIQWLIKQDTEQTNAQLNKVADALTNVAKAWQGTTAINRNLRFKSSEGKGKLLLDWRDSRLALWGEVSEHDFESLCQ